MKYFSLCSPARFNWAFNAYFVTLLVVNDSYEVFTLKLEDVDLNAVSKLKFWKQEIDIALRLSLQFYCCCSCTEFRTGGKGRDTLVQ